ncbi:flavin monoamine oxidase family protein [Hansschlegelia beijingensis]|uniref:flavin monoamine oxidase family protein n=1 Tax=Hansschlegelia beijingensis TaxID=1133344 RepID=UPI00380495C3
MSKAEVEVAVVGAGAAGIGAARRLHDAGVDVLLIEARARLGGRSFTEPDPAVGPLDLGCGWLHSGDENPWTAIAERQGHAVERSAAPWSKAALEAGFPVEEQADFRAASERFHERLAEAASCSPDRPAAACLEPGGRWNELLDAVSTYVSGAELQRVSARDLAAYRDTGVNWRLDAGYGAVIARHADGVPLALDCPVSEIDHSGRRIRLTTPQGEISAERAIVTLPTDLLAQEAVTFRPALPEKSDAARGLPLGLADKLYMALEGAEEFEVDSRAFGRTDHVATGSYHFRPLGRPLIEGYFGGALAADLERGGPAAFFDFARQELTGLFGAAFARRLRPLASHSWGADPYARGSYSFASPGMAGQREILAASVADRLFFAGEACSPRDYSTAHGALRTGLAAADAILAARGRR